MPRARLSAAALAITALAAGCATGASRTRQAEPGPDCHDGKFRGVYRPAQPDEQARRVHVMARVCRGGELLVQVRGAVGGPVLYVAVDGDRLLLVLPRERRAVEGHAADRELWLSETGLPFDGRLLRAMLSGEASGSLGGWEVVLDRPPGARFPRELLARHADGARLSLERRQEKRADARPIWPEVPADFERVSYDRGP